MTSPPASPTGTPSTAADRALAAAAAGENAAGYACEVAGAFLEGSQLTRVRSELAAHRARVDTLTATLASRGVGVPPARPAYALPAPVTDAGSARRLLAGVDARLADGYADVVVATTGATRVSAARWLQEAAVRAAGWRGGSVAFPGLPERAG